MTIALLILHGLLGTALLGAITHQLVSAIRAKPARTTGFFDRYAGVNQRVFTWSVVVLFLIQVLVGAVIYPDYRLDVRIPFEQMHLGKAIGSFELKEHFAGVGLALLPFYVWLWKPERAQTHTIDRMGITGILAFIVWFDFLAGHVLNNIRGLV